MLETTSMNKNKIAHTLGFTTKVQHYQPLHSKYNQQTVVQLVQTT